MAIIYHHIPQNMKGTILYPLNTLAQKADLVDIYKAHLQKYDARKEILDIEISSLNCKWNDVLHFSPVHPQRVADAIIEAGHTWRKKGWYCIDTEDLDKDKLCIYTHNTIIGPVPPNEFIPFDEHTLAAHTTVTPDARRYYQETARDDRRPLIFVGIPHVLYKGSIDITESKIIIA